MTNNHKEQGGCLGLIIGFILGGLITLAIGFLTLNLLPAIGLAILGALTGATIGLTLGYKYS